MSTGIDLAGDLMGMLAESVERGASMLAGGTRLAGPAAATGEHGDQDAAQDNHRQNRFIHG